MKCSTTEHRLTPAKIWDYISIFWNWCLERLLNHMRQHTLNTKLNARSCKIEASASMYSEKGGNTHRHNLGELGYLTSGAYIITCLNSIYKCRGPALHKNRLGSLYGLLLHLPKNVYVSLYPPHASLSNLPQLPECPPNWRILLIFL